jgi:hypothetical protein
MKTSNSLFSKLLLSAAATVCVPAAAQTLPSPNQVNVSVAATTVYDQNTGLFTYNYTLTNFSGALLEVDSFVVPLRLTSIVNVQSPPGWESVLHSDGSMINWCACSENGFTEPAGYVQDGRGLPSKFQIKPGQTLSGFSFQSAFPPSAGEFYAGGWVPVFIEGVDFPEGQEPPRAAFPNNLFRGALVAAPLSNPTLEYGGRRPAVDGFLVFTSLNDGGSYPAPLLIDVQFGPQGEVVDGSTFKATLNGVDITSQFVSIEPKKRRAQLAIGAALKSGKNVLITTVQGTVPGAARSAKDTDRVTFLIQ